MDMNIKKAVSHIKEQTGIEVVLDEYFNEIYYHKGSKYFNIITDNPVYMANEVVKLERLTSYSSLIKQILPNGHKRLAIVLH